MKNNTSKKLLVITLLFAAIFSLLPAVTQAAKVDCFAEFERCINEDVRTSFFKGFFDFLDCETSLAACLKKAFSN
ncbi:MAG: hypothetical protein RBR88_05675 [Candidatus Saccharicenans sp.]|nr:hypothetical protein [Candidatus Saccharicenans sp.]